MADRKTIGKVVNNMKNPENFDVSYHIHEGIGEPVIYADENSEMYNLETKENVPIEEVFLGKEYPIEYIIIAHGAFAIAKIDTLTIPEGVTEVPMWCFNYAKITTLKLPSTLETISDSAFKSAEIDTLVIPEGVKGILWNCFEGAKITTLKLPNSLKEILDEAFAIAKIDTLVIPKGVTKIPNDCFYGAKITTLELPNTLETIGEYAFKNAEIESPLYIKNVSSIGEDAFKGFQGTIFTDNKESKAKFVKAGLDTKQVVNLSSREECFKALKNKTFQEIRQLEQDFGREIWDKDYLNKIKQGVNVKDRKLPYALEYSNMTLSDAAKLKNEMLNVLEQKLNKASMFQEGGSNHNKHTNPDSPQPKRP